MKLLKEIAIVTALSLQTVLSCGEDSHSSLSSKDYGYSFYMYACMSLKGGLYS